MWKNLQQKQQQINLNCQNNCKHQYTYTLWYEQQSKAVKHHKLFVIIRLEIIFKQKLNKQNKCLITQEVLIANYYNV
jgi:hypothetical protein